MSAESLLTKLTPGTFALEKKSPGGGAKLEASDIAMACSGLTPAEWALVSYKWGHNASELGELYVSVYERIRAVALRESWPALKKGAPDRESRPSLDETITRLTRMAVHEVVDHHACIMCRGNGTIGHVHCEVCDGTGRKRPTHEDRARYLGMSLRAFYGTRGQYGAGWRARYDECYRIAQSVEWDALCKVSENIG